MNPNKNMIIDTSVWVALLDESDSCHETAIERVANINPDDLYLLDYIYSETMTVLRRKRLESKISELMHFISDLGIEIRFMDKLLFNITGSMFVKFGKLSFTDCALLATAKFTKSELVTFDGHLEKAYQEISG